MIARLDFILIGALASASLWAQGSLTPPSGPAPSMKTLGQIEPRVAIEQLPFKISAPGAYYVAANLVVPDNTSGISIEASNVTLDLNGFTISGSFSFESAIIVVAGRSDVAIHNGAITGVGGGIDASGGTHVRLDALRVTKCLAGGISIGADSTVSNCNASENGSAGIVAGANSTISNSQANANGGSGIEAGPKSTVRDSSAARNAGAGIFAGDFSKIIAATATDNNGFGMNGGVGVHFIDCTASANRQSGINGGRLTSVTRANATFNSQSGISVGDSSSVTDSTLSGNGLTGIFAGATAHVADCKADSNGGGGISVQSGSTVRDCSVQRNGNDGIACTDQCTILRNTAHSNSNLKGAAGIHVKGTDNVIEENIVAVNDRGIALAVEGNFVTKNRATNNSLNFFTVGDQMMAPVLNTFDAAEAINPLSNFTF